MSLKLIEACQKGIVDEVKQLLEANYSLIERDAEDKRSALHYAAMGGNVDITNLLIEHICQKNKQLLDAPDKKGKTPLQFATQEGRTEIVKLLLDAGAQVDSENSGGQTALHYAVNGNNFELVKLLVDRGANTNKINIDGQSALHYAAQVGSVEIMKYLIDHKSNVNALTKDHFLPLHFAVAYQHEDLVALLLNSHAVLPNSVLETETSPNIDKMLEDFVSGVTPAMPSAKKKLTVEVAMEKTPVMAVLQTPATPVVDLQTPLFLKENPFKQ